MMKNVFPKQNIHHLRSVTSAGLNSRLSIIEADSDHWPLTRNMAGVWFNRETD